MVSPTAGFKHLEKWQPESSKVFDTDDIDGDVELSLFMTFNGPEPVFEACGIDAARHSVGRSPYADVNVGERQWY